MNNRRFDIDNLKGILIYFVVLGHLLFPVSLKNSGYCYDVSSFVYFFHMPFFLFLSGMVSKRDKTKDYLLKYSLFYILFNFSYAFFDFFVNKKTIDFIHPYYSMWFLLVLIVCKIVISLTDSFILLPVSLFISIFSGFLQLDNTFAISRIFGMSFFYFFGYFLVNKFKIYEFKENRKTYYHILPFIGICYIISIFTTTTRLSINDFYMFYGFNNRYEFIYRMLLVVLNIFLILTAFLIMPNKKIPVITAIGQNSLNIYLFHRFICLIFEKIFIPDILRLIISIVLAIFIVLLLGNKFFAAIFNKFYVFVLNKRFLFSLVLIACISICEIFPFVYKNTNTKSSEVLDLEDNIKVSFIGDMLLFRDDIEKARTDNGFDFSPYFEYVKDEFGDYVFGTFEGVVSDSDYVCSNYNDGLELKLKYPKEFAMETSKNIDFVSICNNHMFDGGLDSLSDTKKTLEEFNLNYSDGTDIKIVDIDGFKVAVLSYTYGTNFEEDLKFTNILNDENVLKDFNNLKNFDFDKILVMVHSGTEFSNDINYEQDYYSKFFNYLGADFIYFDHSHSVEPIKFIGDSLVIYGLGNFCSSYTGNNCDIGAICNVYLSKDDFDISCVSIVPIRTVLEEDKVSHPVLAYDISDIDVSSKVFNDSLNKNINYNLKEYFFSKDFEFIKPFIKKDVDSKNLFDEDIMFLGDSLTFGYKNQVPFYGAIDFKNSKVTTIGNLSGNGWTSSDLLKELKDYNREELYEYDSFFIAIGINDIRYLGENNSLFKNLESIVNILPSNKKIYIISPWKIFKNRDKHIIVNDEILSEINNDLEKFCNENDLIFLDLNPYIEDNIKESSRYMMDYIHPNLEGIKIYSEALINALEGV